MCAWPTVTHTLGMTQPNPTAPDLKRILVELYPTKNDEYKAAERFLTAVVDQYPALTDVPDPSTDGLDELIAAEFPDDSKNPTAWGISEVAKSGAERLASAIRNSPSYRFITPVAQPTWLSTLLKSDWPQYVGDLGSYSAYEEGMRRVATAFRAHYAPVSITLADLRRLFDTEIEGLRAIYTSQLLRPTTIVTYIECAQELRDAVLAHLTPIPGPSKVPQ